MHTRGSRTLLDPFTIFAGSRNEEKFLKDESMLTARMSAVNIDGNGRSGICKLYDGYSYPIALGHYLPSFGTPIRVRSAFDRH